MRRTGDITKKGLRAIFSIQIATLAYQYDIDVEGELASIFPSVNGAS